MTRLTAPPWVALAVALPAAAVVPPAPRSLALANARVSGTLCDVTAAEAVDRLAALAGATPRGHVREASRGVCVHFEAVPLDEAFRRVLGTQSFTLVYGQAGAVRAVRLVPDGSPPPASPPPPPALGGETETPRGTPSAGHLAQLLGHEVRVSPGSPLAQALGASRPTVPEVFAVARDHASAGVRQEAVEVIVAELERDPSLRAAALTALATMPTLEAGSDLPSRHLRSMRRVLRAAVASRDGDLSRAAEETLGRLRAPR